MEPGFKLHRELGNVKKRRLLPFPGLPVFVLREEGFQNIGWPCFGIPATPPGQFLNQVSLDRPKEPLNGLGLGVGGQRVEGRDAQLSPKPFHGVFAHDPYPMSPRKQFRRS